MSAKEWYGMRAIIMPDQICYFENGIVIDTQKLKEDEHDNEQSSFTFSTPE